MALALLALGALTSDGALVGQGSIPARR